MSSLPTPSQIAGKQYQLYEAYYNQTNKNPDGTIPAMEGAKFLKRSGLSDAILSKIWDMSDPGGKGCLDKSGLFMSVKLITLAQTGRDVTNQNAVQDLDDLPEMSGDKPIIRPPSAQAQQMGGGGGGGAMDIGEDMIAMYQKMFVQVAEPGPPGQPMCVPGNKAKGMMLESKLPVDILGKIWDMSDTNRDGALDEPEFLIALHLVQTAKRGLALPPALPPDFVNTVRRGMSKASGPPRKPSLVSSPPPVAMPVMPMPVVQPPPIMPPKIPSAPTPPQVTPLVSHPHVPSMPLIDGWVVTQEERVKYGNLFLQTDEDHDGFISGGEIRNLFLQSGIPQPILAHIWNLCDEGQQGKLTRDQFILAMWLIHRKVVEGVDPPNALTQEMKIPTEADKEEMMNPEFELILKEILELSNEKNNLDCEIQSKESEKKVKNGELKSLQAEFDTLAATLKQLENQKNIAKTKLADLETQVTTLRDQAEQQESTLVEQETELSEKRTELTSLDSEMSNNEKEQKEISNKMDQLTDLKQQTQLKISKIKTQISDLQELENTMKSCLTKYDDCVDNNNYLTAVTETDLRDLGLEFDEICEFYNNEVKTPVVKEAPQFEKIEDNANSYYDNRFDNQFDPSPFDGFQQQQSNSYNQPASNNDDPFAALRPETAHAWPAEKPRDPFAPPTMGGGLPPLPKSPAGFGDAFGNEPFGNNGHGQDAPHLPPKKPPPPKGAPSRPPPPKGAPARPPPPSKAAPSPAPSTSSGDPFGGGGGDFADFANFDSAQFSSPWSSSSSGATKPSSSLSFNLSSSKIRSRSQQKQPLSPWGDFPSSTLPVNSRSHGQGHHTATNYNGSKSSGSGRKQRSASNLDFTEDPFKNYRYEDPFALSVDPFLNNNNNSSTHPNSNNNNNFNSNSGNGSFDPFK